ncbi:MAG TPA: nucleotidyltransferase domain-containing protein [Solirubrobacteraceae bacterium]|nr:nucleotidyltransferase domain-containing protein [Solirubrobacteraceae bacterium]
MSEALLNTLRAALRTEPGVRLAVLFGSNAVGEDGPDSDVDLLVAHRESTAHALVGLRLRLECATNQRVHIVDLEQAEVMPTLLADVLDEGRVLLDRDGLWAQLRERSGEVHAAAEREEQALAAGARAAVEAARERIRGGGPAVAPSEDRAQR